MVISCIRVRSHKCVSGEPSPPSHFQSVRARAKHSIPGVSCSVAPRGVLVNFDLRYLLHIRVSVTVPEKIIES